MGTVNYYTSNYITMGIEPISRYDLENDPGFMEEIQEDVNEYGGSIEGALDHYIEVCFDDALYNVKHELNSHSFQYFNITIEPGYYEGFSLNIENTYGEAFDSYKDRREAQKEITEIRKMFEFLAGCGIVSVWPGWCTTYRNYTETLADIREAVKEMRAEVKATPTWTQYERTKKEMRGKEITIDGEGFTLYAKKTVAAVA